MSMEESSPAKGDKDPAMGDKGPANSAGPLQLTELAYELRSLLRFAITRTEVRISDEVIDATMAACAKVDTNKSPSEAELWKCYNLLTDLVAPATPDTIRQTGFIMDRAKQGGSEPNEIRGPVHDLIANAKKIVGWTIFALIIVQIYTTALLNAYNNYEVARFNLIDALAMNYEIKGEVDCPGQDCTYRPSVCGEISKINGLVDKFNASGSTIHWLTFFILSDEKLTIYLDDVCNKDDIKDKITKDKINKEVKSSIENAKSHGSDASGIFHIIIKAFSIHVLTILYGWLGANVYILRELIAGLDSWSLSIMVDSKQRLRRLLGALLGVVVGLVYQSEPELLPGIGINLALSAFLAGYCVEFVFTILDMFVDRGRAIFTQSAPPLPPITPPKADRGAGTGAAG